ncbi:hypothetical protein H6F89_34305 [Cyanobacteria bacterium FACHB-63]|nr:hypothetical protein [Cyanobacteria bacterium FACHB-63]
MTVATERKTFAPGIEALLRELEPGSDLEKECFELFQNGDYEGVKSMRARNLDSSYFRAMSYVCGVVGAANPASPTHKNLGIIYAEAANAAADYLKEKCLKRLSESYSW